MANGIQSLLNPDKKKRKYPFEGRYPYRDSFPDTLPTAQLQEMLRGAQALGFAKDWNQAQTDPAELLPVMDSLTALIQSNNPDEKMVRLMDEQESLVPHPVADFFNAVGYYNKSLSDPTMWINQPVLYGLINPTKSWSGEFPGAYGSRKTAIHEAMHHLNQVALKDPELHKKFGLGQDLPPNERTVGWRHADVHGPQPFTVNTLTAAWDALASLSDDGKASKEDVINYMVENFHRYDSPTPTPRALSKRVADSTVTWLADQDPFKTELYERTMLEKLRRGVLSLFGRDK
jgi:hypothetical protein